MPDYLTRAEIEAIHADQVTRYGGSPGLRDPGQLEAALYRPLTGYYEDLIAQAAALWESLSQNHPFVDGNYRTALTAAVALLAGNDAQVTAGPDILSALLDHHHTNDSLDFAVLDALLRVRTSSAGR